LLSSVFLAAKRPLEHVQPQERKCARSVRISCSGLACIAAIADSARCALMTGPFN
jgi:hypothetical protein